MKWLVLIPLLPIILSWSGFRGGQLNQTNNQTNQSDQLNSAENIPCPKPTYNSNLRIDETSPSDIEANENLFYEQFKDLNTEPIELERI